MDEDDFPEIKLGNGVDRDLAATTNDRLKKAVLELRDLKKVISELNVNLIRFTTSSDKYSKKLIFLTWILVLFTIGLVVLTFVLIKDAKEQVSSQNNIALNAQFYTSANNGIINTIERNQPILTPQGKYTTDQLDNYLGDYEVIDSAYKEGLLTEENLCVSFATPADLTLKNKEVQDFISASRKENPSFYAGFSEVANAIEKSKNPNCH